MPADDVEPFECHDCSCCSDAPVFLVGISDLIAEFTESGSGMIGGTIVNHNDLISRIGFDSAPSIQPVRSDVTDYSWE
ncbi:MAG: hypothetical protein U5R06_13120 [candidate division KSB1 bacterium]|nr:hypothetical protein [candidate division KSB1 bacterium]